MVKDDHSSPKTELMFSEFMFSEFMISEREKKMLTGQTRDLKELTWIFKGLSGGPRGVQQTDI